MAKRKLVFSLLLALTLTMPLQGLALAQHDEVFAPRVVDHLPFSGQELPLDGAIDIFFDQPMDHDAVEAAFSIVPSVEGSFRWLDAATLRFAPDETLARGTEYRVTVGTGAAAVHGMTLVEPYSFTVQTVGFLEVSQTVPADGAVNVKADSRITVVFNRPVVPLRITEETDTLPDPLIFDPDVSGEGEWLNTSIYVFTPDTLVGGTTYTVSVAAGLEDTIGGVLGEDFTWTFSTWPPGIISIEPVPQEDIALDETFFVYFSEAMDHASTEAAFSFFERPGMHPVAGTLSWENDDTKLVFTPDDDLKLATLYGAILTSEATSAIGEVPLDAGFEWEYTTVPYPAIIDTAPHNADVGVEVYRNFDIYFASPMDRETLEDKIHIKPEPEDVYYYYNDYDNHLSAMFNKQPSTHYTVTIDPGMADIYGNTIDQGLNVHFKTADFVPSVSLNMPRTGVYSAYVENTQVFARYRNISSLDFVLSSMSVEDMMMLSGPRSWDAWQEYSPGEDALVRAWSVPVEPERNKHDLKLINLNAVEDEALPPGFYYLRLDTPETLEANAVPAAYLAIVATANLTLKVSTDTAFVWVTDWESGEPVMDARVVLYDQEQREIAHGSTNRDGVLEARIPSLKDLYEVVFAVVDDGENFAFACSSWREGISPWDFGLNTNFYPAHETVYIYTDRAVYRPGQTIYFKGIVRDRDDVTYSVPHRRRIPVSIDNSHGETVYQEELELSEFGTFSGEFTIDSEGVLGRYHVVADYQENIFTLSFNVAEYRLPEFTVSVVPDKREVLPDDTINVTTDGTFYFGGPVSDASVDWVVVSDNYNFQYTGEGYYDFVDYNYDTDIIYEGGYGEEIASGSGTTDAEGKFSFDLSSTLEDKTQSQRYTIDVTLMDVSGQMVSNHESVIVHQGEIYVGLHPERYVSTAGQETTVNVITVDWDSAAVVDQTVELTAFERRWSSVQEEDETGFTIWTWQVEEIEAASGEVVTGDDGKATFSFTPESGGAYKIVAVTRDAQGNEVRSSTFLWVSSHEYVSWRQRNSKRIDIIADRDDYKVGDEAEILITSPFQGEALALVTIERADVLEYEIITLDTNSYIYKLPIEAMYAPTIYVNVIIVKGVDENNPVADFRIGMVGLDVSTEQKQINVELVPSTEQAQPGDTVTYDITTTDYTGAPVSAEVGLALTDKAALDIIMSNSGTLVEHFYNHQGLGVNTALLLTRSVDYLTQHVFDAIKGGGGGGGGVYTLDLREHFVDTPYWEAHLVTDADGHATVDVTLPDNLTTWHMDARAISEDTLVGQASVDIVSTKPVLIRPVTPRFLVVGDKTILGAVVNNNTDEDLEVEVSLSEAIGLDVADDLTQTISIKAGAHVRVNWSAEVLPVEFVQLIFAVEGDGYQDASRPTLGQGENQVIPVYRYEAPETVGTGGVLTEAGARTEAVALPRTMDVTRGDLAVEVTPSLAAATLDGLDYLENYPYMCVEQTVSRFLPNIMTYRALDSFGLADPDLVRNLRRNVNSAVQRLYAQQHIGGGWGWWVNDDSNITVTAYAVLGLVEARSAGFEVSGDVIDQALEYLKGNLRMVSMRTPTYVLNRQAFVLYVLARAGAGDTARTVLLYSLRARMNYDARAFLVMTFAKLEGAHQTRIDSLLSDLNNAAILSATGAHWEEEDIDYWNWSTDTRTTAIVLSALVQLDPENPITEQAVRWLMVARRAKHWETTQETAWALMALTDWMVATGELEADYSFELLLNGTQEMSGAANADTLRDTNTLRIAITDLLAEEVNRLTIMRGAGPGAMYYTTHLNVYLPVEEVAPLNRGIILDRRYSLSGDEDHKPITEAHVGDMVDVTLTIIAPHDLYYVVIEDPIPAGAEAVDTSLLTTSVVGERPHISRTDPLHLGWGWWWFSHTEMRDEKVVLSATQLPRGTYEYHYQVRVGMEGEYRVIPPTGYEFYFSEVYGRGAGSLFTILPEE